MKVKFLLFFTCFHLSCAALDVTWFIGSATACYYSHPINLVQLYTDMATGNKNPEKELTCYSACVGSTLNLVLNGRPSSEGFQKLGKDCMEHFGIDNIPKRLNGLEQVRSECDSEINQIADICTVAYQFTECYYRKTLPTGFWPPIVEELMPDIIIL